MVTHLLEEPYVVKVWLGIGVNIYACVSMSMCASMCGCACLCAIRRLSPISVGVHADFVSDILAPITLDAREKSHKSEAIFRELCTCSPRHRGALTYK